MSFKIEVKAFEDGDKRIIEGWATRPQEDRSGDIVIPTGVKYQLPLPFLLDHDPEKAVGSVDKVEVSDKGIRFVASIRKIDNDTSVARACDNAWTLLKNNLRNHVSIGFRTLAYEIREPRGWVIKEWEWLELSAVTIPALPTAAITGLKKYGDAQIQAGGSVKQVEASKVLPKGCFHLVSNPCA